VGAGLPINHTVRDLIDSGDTILSISGIFSGTFSWLFLQFDGTVRSPIWWIRHGSRV
jgi:aspartokinase/homoserine dehydrogenase 2